MTEISISELARIQADRARLRRKSEKANHETDMVIELTHNKVRNLERMAIEKHAILDDRKGKTKYIIKDEAESNNVLELGKEINMFEFGYDHAIVAVDTVTGERSFRPANLLQFSATHVPDVSVALGQKRKKAVDYSALFVDDGDDKWAKRRELTQNFGSSKKIKFQEASLRRSINSETLDAMRKTAFASTSVLKTEVDIKPDQISLIKEVQSAVLPPAQKAELPRDIYPLETFITAEEIDAFSDLAMEYMKNGKSVLVANGVPTVVAKLYPADSTANNRTAVAWTLLSTMAGWLSTFSSSRNPAKTDIEALSFPEAFVQKLLVTYFPNEYSRGVTGAAKPKLETSKPQRDRLLAHTLALAITLSPACTLPITPWQLAFKVSSGQIEKLLSGMGCDVVQCNAQDALRYDSLRMARLLRVPEPKSKNMKSKARGGR